MLCAARAQVGPLGQCFWALWDREGERSYANTRLRPGSTEVRMDGPEIVVEARDLQARLTLGDSAPIESICPSGSGWGWTRKRAGVPIEATIETPDGALAAQRAGRRRRVGRLPAAPAPAGTGRRASAGQATDARSPGTWSRASTTHRRAASARSGSTARRPSQRRSPSRASAQCASRAAPSSTFTPGSERARKDNFLVFRSQYRHLFGDFSGSLDGLELAEGFGVMEQHEAVW